MGGGKKLEGGIRAGLEDDETVDNELI